jgi:mannose-1-phosphate guanylyltransferase/mannose-6-phosphate isomerase
MVDDSNREQVGIHAVILAGGSGTRLWPLSRLQLPKQFLRLKGEHTLLEDTIQRLAPIITSDQVLIVTGAEHANGEAYNSLKSYQTLLEPVGRNTAPAIALAAAWLSLLEPEADPVMVVLPADHIISNVPAFHAALNQAIDSAFSGKLVTFGIQPTRPDTGFGYIKAGEGTDGSLPVEHFAEKPDLETAQQFLNEGSYYWNSGMFVWRCSIILHEIRTHLPGLYENIEKIMAAWKQGTPYQIAIDEFFPIMESISIDYGVLEKSECVSLVPCDIDWSDVGSWDAVYEIAEKDGDGNSLQGNALIDACSNTLIHSNKRLVAAVGVEDLCIVETADAVLVAKRGETQRVRNIVDSLKQSNAQEHLVHLTVQRPWGRYTVLEEQPGYKMKRITVEPGARLSLQSHQHRSEHWIVVSGTATVTRGKESFTVIKNQSTYIPIGEKHRLENLGKIPLEMIEVQVGEYLSEDDIERFDDNYGRD